MNHKEFFVFHVEFHYNDPLYVVYVLILFWKIWKNNIRVLYEYLLLYISLRMTSSVLCGKLALSIWEHVYRPIILSLQCIINLIGNLPNAYHQHVFRKELNATIFAHKQFVCRIDNWCYDQRIPFKCLL